MRHFGLSAVLNEQLPTMTMNLRLTEAETEALQRKAAEEGRSMHEVARAAIGQIRSDDAELLDRLSP